MQRVRFSLIMTLDSVYPMVAMWFFFDSPLYGMSDKINTDGLLDLFLDTYIFLGSAAPFLFYLFYVDLMFARLLGKQLYEVYEQYRNVSNMWRRFILGVITLFSSGLVYRWMTVSGLSLFLLAVVTMGVGDAAYMFNWSKERLPQLS